MAPIRILVVDDSAVIRRLVTTVLEDDPELVVAGTANNGRNALDRITQLKPDLVTLDVEMPVMDGLETMRNIHRSWPKLPVIMFSTLTERGASATLDALGAGARDYVTKPANVGSFSDAVQAVRDQLIPKIKALCGRSTRPAAFRPAPAVPAAPPVAGAVAPSRTAPAAPRVVASKTVPGGRADVLVIGCSTGGPDALTQVLQHIPADFPLPILVVQHMPPVFTKLFAERLDRACPLSVSEASAGDTVRVGHVLVAPGDHHMEARREGTAVKVRLHEGPPENYCRPAVDVLFRSAASVWGGNILALVLTGMGRDGALGAEQIVRAGGRVVVQDERTSVVWGMPGTIAQAGLASAVLPLDEIAPALVRAANGSSSPSLAGVSR